MLYHWATSHPLPLELCFQWPLFWDESRFDKCFCTNVSTCFKKKLHFNNLMFKWNCCMVLVLAVWINIRLSSWHVCLFSSVLGSIIFILIYENRCHTQPHLYSKYLAILTVDFLWFLLSIICVINSCWYK
jgi:hypothetical protein